MNIEVRRMMAADVRAVALIDAMSLPLPWPERAYQYELTVPHSCPWVAEIALPLDKRPLEYRSPLGQLVRQPGERAIVGMLVLWKIVDEAHIATLAVHPEVRRQGIAKRLLEEALSNAAAEGARSAFLEVRLGNLAAQELYQQLGFRVDGQRRSYYSDNHEDALLMSLKTLESFRALVESRS
jgi:ribosomal-protein-alanine N-acetyltransferase